METPQKAARFASTPSQPGIGESLDRQLIEAVGTGDREAFHLLYQRWHARLSTALLRLCLDREIADDLLQDVMLTVWRRAGSFDPRRGDVGAWLYTICRHRAIDLHRRASVRPPANSDDSRSVAVSEAGPRLGAMNSAASAALDDLQIDLDRALGQLETRESHAIRLAFFGGLTHREIAEQLQIPLGTLKSRIRLGLRKLALFFDSCGRL